uniref:Immunoglobulin V-set domain-containing protein n=1 Tax=Monopterus albus TaxID=43700 RepID=A0A3Q3K9Q8_MONAL
SSDTCKRSFWCAKGAFVYSRVGGDTLLPCTGLVSADCSHIFWTFYKGGQVRYTQEVSWGQVRAESDKSSRMSITSNCSLHLRDLRIDDAGSYVCLHQGQTITDVYLSLLTITSVSRITDLQLGGNLILSCILFTYYDAGSCKSYSSAFSLSWVAKDGTSLATDSRYELTGQTRCNITLVTKLQMEDNNRKWRCQVNTTETSRAAFQDFTSTFLFQNPPIVQSLTPSAAMHCPVHLPISRIVLCVALPVMVIIVGLFTWRNDRKRAKKTAASVKFRETC